MVLSDVRAHSNAFHHRSGTNHLPFSIHVDTDSSSDDSHELGFTMLSSLPAELNIAKKGHSSPVHWSSE